MVFARVTWVILVLAPLAIQGYPFKLPLESTPHVVNYDPRWSHVRPHETNLRRVGTMTRRMGRGESGDDERFIDDEIDYSADPLTAFLGKFLPKDRTAAAPQAKDLVFNTEPEAKRRGLSAGEMAAAVEEGLIRHGWFVTGELDASLFSDDFSFQDPQVSLTGVEKYAEGVAKLFDQEESRCDVISSEADGDDIVVRWRLAGRVNLPFKPPIKPYVVTTTFTRDADGLLRTQKDEFSIKGWDILLHAVFPGHPFGAEPAPPVPPRA